jgi:hypothetical protein
LSILRGFGRGFGFAALKKAERKSFLSCGNGWDGIS